MFHSLPDPLLFVIGAGFSLAAAALQYPFASPQSVAGIEVGFGHVDLAARS